MNGTDFPANGWRKSSYSGEATSCVEVATTRDAVGVRDTKCRTAGTLVFSDDAWARFVTSLASSSA